MYIVAHEKRRFPFSPTFFHRFVIFLLSGQRWREKRSRLGGRCREWGQLSSCHIINPNLFSCLTVYTDENQGSSFKGLRWDDVHASVYAPNRWSKKRIKLIFLFSFIIAFYIQLSLLFFSFIFLILPQNIS